MPRFPEPPDLERDVVDALVAYAEQCATWLEQDMREAAALGHRPSAEQQDNLRGYRFTALFLAFVHLGQAVPLLVRPVREHVHTRG
jgi:hypothetical protein